MIYENRELPKQHQNVVDIYVEHELGCISLRQADEFNKQPDLICIDSEADVDRLIGILQKLKVEAFPKAKTWEDTFDPDGDLADEEWW